MTMTFSAARRALALGLLPLLAAMAAPLPSSAQQPAAGSPPPARLMLLGLFHFDNPGLDAVKYEPRDVMQPAEQAYLAALASRLAGFKPTRIVLEYPERSDEKINARYAEYLAGRLELPRNEIYQIGFRVARLAGLARVHGFDAPMPEGEPALWGYLSRDPAAERRLEALIVEESARLQRAHRTMTLAQLLRMSNSPEEDRRNKGFYMLLNDVGVGQGLFHGADASASWWQRNLRMYALLQHLAQPGERLLVIAGSGHTALLRDFLRADGQRREDDVLPHL